MSSIRLLKDHKHPVTGEKNAKGDVISVPFGVGKDLIRDGIGVWHGGEAKAAPPASVPDEIKKVKDEAIAALKAQEERHAAAIASLQQQLNAVAAERDELAKKLKAK